MRTLSVAGNVGTIVLTEVEGAGPETRDMGGDPRG